MIHLAILGIPALLLFTGPFWFRPYTCLSHGKALLALAASVVAGVVLVMVPMIRRESMFSHHDEAEIMMRYAAAAIAIVFLTAFVLRLWGRWVGENATWEERQPGQPGVRAWFSTANMTVGLILVLTLWQGFDFSPWLIAAAIGGSLIAYPLIRMESPAAVEVPVADDLSAEREKILTMLESGKLTADESAELLQALRQSPPASPRQMPLTSGQRLMLIGAALVGLGFFLPWFVINPGKELNRAMSDMQSTMNSSFGMEMNFPGTESLSEGPIQMKSVSVSGGDIQRGLGWATLAFALIAAFLPYVATTLDTATARTIRMLCLGMGGIIVLYLVTQNPRFVGIGLVMAFCGYVLEGIGVFREGRSPLVSRAS
ncbi:MAG: hypothetical protein ABIS50_16750 [Luteolibacter sp.]|uniref:SHOCT-like domain-containing protein n=1 Tax=Luteolibacter sp. TaxID=1962973 RepID=UPI003266C828